MAETSLEKGGRFPPMTKTSGMEPIGKGKYEVGKGATQAPSPAVRFPLRCKYIYVEQETRLHNAVSMGPQAKKVAWLSLRPGGPPKVPLTMMLKKSLGRNKVRTTADRERGKAKGNCKA